METAAQRIRIYETNPTCLIDIRGRRGVDRDWRPIRHLQDVQKHSMSSTEPPTPDGPDIKRNQSGAAHAFTTLGPTCPRGAKAFRVSMTSCAWAKMVA